MARAHYHLNLNLDEPNEGMVSPVCYHFCGPRGEWHHPYDTTCPSKDSYRNPCTQRFVPGWIPIGIHPGTDGQLREKTS